MGLFSGPNNLDFLGRKHLKQEPLCMCMCAHACVACTCACMQMCSLGNFLWVIHNQIHYIFIFKRHH
jgi:hypothetical protein